MNLAIVPPSAPTEFHKLPKQPLPPITPKQSKPNSILTTSNTQPTTVNPATLSYTPSISRHIRDGRFPEAQRLFTQMLNFGVKQNYVTIVAILSGCADLGSRYCFLGNSVHAYARKLGLVKRNVVVGTALMEMYAKSGSLDLARLVFDEMSVRNSVTWNTMIDGYVRKGEIEDALKLFDEMPSRDVISWTVLINGFVRWGYFEEALEVFREMLISGTSPDYVTVICVINACANLGSIRLGLWVNRFVMGKEFKDNVRVCNALIDMYCRCGYVNFAQRFFENMPKRTVVSWNSMIVGCAASGLVEEALKLFEQMQIEGFKPDGVSFTGTLTACSHAGLVDEGIKYFNDMQNVHKIVPRIEHYGCLVDLYSRSGRLQEAMNVIKTMPMEPNDVVLGSLLASCRIHEDVDLAERLTKYLFHMDPDSDSNYVLLANLYAAAGSWDGANKIRRDMKMQGIHKTPGFSSVEIGCSCHEFVASDKAHPEAEHVYRMLDILLFDMVIGGYVPGTLAKEVYEYD